MIVKRTETFRSGSEGSNPSRQRRSPSSRKQALHVCGNVTREAYGSVCRSCGLAPKSAIAEAFAVRIAGAAST